LAAALDLSPVLQASGYLSHLVYHGPDLLQGGGIPEHLAFLCKAILIRCII